MRFANMKDRGCGFAVLGVFWINPTPQSASCSFTILGDSSTDHSQLFSKTGLKDAF
jgi:hypothetical protein